jgi:adenylate cyclase
MPERSLVRRLRERKLVQWALAYLAGAFVVFQLLDALAEPLGLSAALQRAVLVVVAVAFFITLVLAWYHGEKGRQRVSGPELLMTAALLVIAGAALSLLRPRAAPPPFQAAAEGDERPGIAVFPCENWSPDPHDAYFASGIHDEILLQLSRIRALRCIGRESMEWYEKNPRPLRQVAQELGVGYLGECSVRKDAERNRIRLTFQLMNGNTGAQVWAENYDEDLSARDILDIQTDVARRVARAVGAVITPEEDVRLAERPTENTPAYSEYLVGRAALRRRTGEGFRTALRHFENAVAADSTFALAYVGLADTYSLLYSYGLLPSSEAWSRAQGLAERALELDPTLGEAYASLGYVQMRLGWDYESAFSNFERAVELNPGYAEAYLWHAYGLTQLGRVEEADPLFQKALDLDPLNFLIVFTLGSRYAVARKYDRALEERERALAMNPDLSAEITEIQILMGEHDEGLRSLERVAQADSGHAGGRLGLAWGLAVAGREAESRKILESTLGEHTERDLDPVNVAEVYVALGELDAAFAWLERAYQVRSRNLTNVIAWPQWDRLRSDPRFQVLAEKIGAPRAGASR